MKIVSLNIEGDRHLERWPDPVKDFAPTIVCLQEVFRANLDEIAKLLEMQLVAFAPSLRVENENDYGISPLGVWGPAVFALPNLEVLATSHYYAGDENVKTFGKPNDASRAVIVSSVEENGVRFTVANTHFTWSPGGSSTDEQLRDAKALREILAGYPDYVLVGDLNAPRDGKTFAYLREGLIDHIPATVTTTIDPKLHYAGALQLVVDAVLSTHEYSAQVSVRDGLSDHQGLFIEVDRHTL